MLFYSAVVRLYTFIIRLVSPFHRKAALWTAGRRNWRKQVAGIVPGFRGKKVIWFHCASYGEFEQGRPLMEYIRREKPDTKIVLTFFSPSGFEPFHNWSGADATLYLPADTAANARKFLDLLKPDVAVFVKYEFWLHYLFTIRERGIPCYLVSATFKPHHPFFKWYGGLFRKSLDTFTWLFLQDKSSEERLRKIGITHTSVAGDTRFDRVIQVREQGAEIPEIARFKGSANLLVAGSTWTTDENLLVGVIETLRKLNMKLLIAPHEVGEQRIASLSAMLTKAGIRNSLFSQPQEQDCEALILNTIGVLARAYRYADAVYVGGGLEKGLHNTLEPAVYGVPVFFAGNEYHKYNEAVQLLNMGSAFLVQDSERMSKKLDIIMRDSVRLRKIKSDLEIYFAGNKDVTLRIMEKILPALD